ncbi:MAG: acyltransferase family protein [Pseudomonadota bacterium]
MSTQRFYAIDNLRTGMMFIVMFGHALLPYVTVPRSYKDPITHGSFDFVAVFLYAFAMQVFFITAGFAAAALAERRGWRGLWRNRWQRIFLPLLVAYLLLSPLTRGAYTFAKATVATNSVSGGFDVFLLGEWLRWSKLYHLWFLVSLLLFTGIAGLLIVILRDRSAAALAGWGRGVLASRWRALWLTLLVAVTTVPAYVYGSGVGTSAFMQLTMFVFFAFGWFLYSERALLTGLATHWRLEGVLALALVPVCTWSSRARLAAPDDADYTVGLIAGLSNAAIAGLMTFALLGFFLSRLNRATPLSIELGRASYWVYLIHLPVVVAAGAVWTSLVSPSFVKYLLTLAIAVPLIWGSYRLLIVGTPLGSVLLGSAARKPSGDGQRASDS